MISVLLAVTEAPWEADLVQRAEQAPGITVVRRCVDTADLLAAAAVGRARVVLVAEQLPRLDADAIAELRSRGITVLGLVAPAQLAQLAASDSRLARMGVSHLLPADIGADELGRAVNAFASSDHGFATDPQETAPPGQPGSAPPYPPQYTPSQPPAHSAAHPPPYPVADGVDRHASFAAGGGPAGRGRLLAVWGPTGAPGRTTVAVGLAAELAAAGHPTLLADADSYGGSIAQVLGMLDESSGLASAVRSAGSGTLDPGVLARQARQLGTQLLALTGLSRPDRWPELRPAALETVWRVSRELAAITVVDCGFCLESDEELSFDTLAPRRNGATLVTLEEADEVIVVGSADPVGLARLVRALHELDEIVPGTPKRVVVNKARGGVFASSPAEAAGQAVESYAGMAVDALLPLDVDAVDLAIRHGNTLVEVARSSKLRKALQQLATRIARTVHV